MIFRKLESEDLLEKTNIIGKYIKDSNKEEIVKVIDYTEHPSFPISIVILEKEYLNYGKWVDTDTLIRDFDIEEIDKLGGNA